MSKDKDIKTVVPALRFPEFRESDNYEYKPLGSMVEIKGRIGYRGYTTNDIVNKGEGAISLSPTNITDDGVLSFEKCTYITWEKYEESPEIKVRAGYTVLVKTASVGKTAYVKELPEKATINPQLVVLKPKSINDVYLSYLMAHPFVQKQIDDNVGAGAIPNLSQDSISKILTILPRNINEQIKVSKCLGSLDDLISAVSDKIDALKEHKKGLMQQLFPAEGKKTPVLRFPEFKNSPEWQEVKLVDVTDKNRRWSFTGGPFGSNLKASDYTPDGIRVIQLQNIGDGEFINTYKIYTSINKADELLSCNIYSGDIIISKMGDPVGRACIVPTIEDRYVMCSDGIRVVIDEKKYNKYFIYSLINLDKYRKNIDKIATGSTRKRVGIDDLKQLKIILPSNKHEQDKIASCINLLDNQIIKLQQKLVQLKAHKKGLMQQLFPSLNK